MGRNNEQNIKKHNDKLHKEQDKIKVAKRARKEKLKQIVKKFNETPTTEFIPTHLNMIMGVPSSNKKIL